MNQKAVTVVVESVVDALAHADINNRKGLRMARRLLYPRNMNATIHDPRHASVFRVSLLPAAPSPAYQLTVGCNNTSCPDSTFPLGTVLVQAEGRSFWACDTTGRSHVFPTMLLAMRWLRQGCP